MARFSFLSDEHTDEGFGPGTDLVFSVLAVLLAMLAALRLTSLELSGDTDLSLIKREKIELVSAIRQACGVAGEQQTFELGGETEIQSESCQMRILDNPQFQTLIFNEGILFPYKSSTLSGQGGDLIKRIRGALEQQGNQITEIQILGHTDLIGSEQQNLALGSARAMAVFNVLVEKESSPGVNPFSTLISVTTYGYYNPVQRRNSPSFSVEKLYQANRGETLRGLNRRIELNIFFRKSAIASGMAK